VPLRRLIETALDLGVAARILLPRLAVPPPPGVGRLASADATWRVWLTLLPCLDDPSFTAPVPDAALAALADALDAALTAQNADYAAHRQVMHRPEVISVLPGGFAQWMRHRGRAGGQNKVPRVIADPALLEDLEQYVSPSRGTGSNGGPVEQAR